MCDVTRDNFEQVFPEVEALIKQSSFVAFDCEFTALYSGGPKYANRYKRVYCIVNPNGLLSI